MKRAKVKDVKIEQTGESLDRLDEVMFYRNFEEYRKEMDYSERKTTRFFLISLFLMLLSFCNIGLAAYYMGVSSERNSVIKTELTANLITAINNGSDLRSVKNIYENRELVRRSFKELIKPSDKYYSKNIPLSKIFEDLRSKIYLKESPDSSLISRINYLSDEHSQRNPFDGLETNQKDFFENLRVKSGEKYSLISSDLNKLATEMIIKNTLVEKYLNKSNTSFWISIIALFFSIAIGGYQIIQNRKDVPKRKEFTVNNNNEEQPH